MAEHSDDRSGEFTEIIDTFLPIIHGLFRDFKPGSFLHPTEHLDKKLRENPEPLRPLFKNDFNSVYLIGLFRGIEYQVVLHLNINSFSILIVPQTNFDNTSTTTNISCSPYRKIGMEMYTYGIKANGEGPKVSGNTLNRATMAICAAMHIPQLYISDSAGIRCHWDTRIEIQHFSLIRVIVGKPTFYSSLPGNFVNVDAAMDEIAMLQANTSDEDKAYIEEYLKMPFTSSGDCTRINKIVERGMTLLESQNRPIEIFRFIATPYRPTGGRRRKKTRRLRRKKKYTKRI
jgi:hypothetical protein